MNELLKMALANCPNPEVRTLEEFLGGLLDRDPDQLARLPGTPSTVLAAQFTYFAKSSVTLSEELRRDKKNTKKLTDHIWRLDHKDSEQADRNSQDSNTNTPPDEETSHDTHLPSGAPKCRACPTDCR